jgi:hypothetical protein
VLRNNLERHSAHQVLVGSPFFTISPHDDYASSSSLLFVFPQNPAFVAWYNTQHHHSAISFVTPEQRHEGLDRAILNKRHAVYQLARSRNPNRWSGTTRNWKPVLAVGLNQRRSTKSGSPQSKAA